MSEPSLIPVERIEQAILTILAPQNPGAADVICPMAFAWRKAGRCIGGAEGSGVSPKGPDPLRLSPSNIPVAPWVPQAATERPAGSVSLDRVHPADEGDKSKTGTGISGSYASDGVRYLFPPEEE